MQPLAEEALSLPTTVRDHRDSIYRTLMYISVNRNDNAAAAKWGNRWRDMNVSRIQNMLKTAEKSTK